MNSESNEPFIENIRIWDLINAELYSRPAIPHRLRNLKTSRFTDLLSWLKHSTWPFSYWKGWKPILGKLFVADGNWISTPGNGSFQVQQSTRINFPSGGTCAGDHRQLYVTSFLTTAAFLPVSPFYSCFSEPLPPLSPTHMLSSVLHWFTETSSAWNHHSYNVCLCTFTLSHLKRKVWTLTGTRTRISRSLA